MTVSRAQLYNAFSDSYPLTSVWFSVDRGLKVHFIKVEFSLLFAYGNS